MLKLPNKPLEVSQWWEASAQAGPQGDQLPWTQQRVNSLAQTNSQSSGVAGQAGEHVCEYGDDKKAWDCWVSSKERQEASVTVFRLNTRSTRQLGAWCFLDVYIVVCYLYILSIPIKLLTMWLHHDTQEKCKPLQSSHWIPKVPVITRVKTVLWCYDIHIRKSE